MLNRIKNIIYDNRDRQRVLIKLNKGIAGSQSRVLNINDPKSWEFSGFSQNGEDGIIDILRKNLTEQNNYFIEIGSADGIDNNTAWLLFSESYNGIMIDGDSKLTQRARRIISSYSIGLQIHNIFVNLESVSRIKNISKTLNPDVFSLDIDGIDYFIAKKLFEIGFRPKIFVVEYNSVFGPNKSLTIEPLENFNYLKLHKSGLYYGTSIKAWKKLFFKYNYRFISVDSKGVNAFFANPDYFQPIFLNKIKPYDFVENELQLTKFKVSNEEQFQIIQNMKFTKI